MAVIVIGHETTATARWTSSFIVRAFFNDTITVAWTRFHARLMRMLPHPSNGRAAKGDTMQMACYSLVLLRFTPKADMCVAKGHVRFTPESGHVRCN